MLPPCVRAEARSPGLRDTVRRRSLLLFLSSSSFSFSFSLSSSCSFSSQHLVLVLVLHLHLLLLQDQPAGLLLLLRQRLPQPPLPQLPDPHFYPHRSYRPRPLPFLWYHHLDGSFQRGVNLQVKRWLFGAGAS